MKILIIFFSFFVFKNTVFATDCTPYLTSLEIPGKEISPLFHKYQNTYTTPASEITDIIYTLESINAEVEISSRNNIFGTPSAIINVSCKDSSEEYEIILSPQEEQIVFNEVISDEVSKYSNKQIFVFVMIITLTILIIIAMLFFRKTKI